MKINSKNKSVLLTAATVLCINLMLFFIKLFIGLSANSISVYSDAVNNLFDSLSGALTLGSVIAVSKGAGYFAEKTEQLLSLIISCFIGFSGVYFLYSSAERLMYPTPVWYTQKYFILLCMTAAVKLFLAAVFRRAYKKSASPVTRLMATDSLLDFFISCTTVMTLLLSRNGRYAFDAVCGIIISVIISVSAVKGIVNAVRLLINYVSSEKRTQIENILLSSDIINDVSSIRFASPDMCIVTAAPDKDDTPDTQKICELIRQQTGIDTIIIRKGNQYEG